MKAANGINGDYFGFSVHFPSFFGQSGGSNAHVSRRGGQCNYLPSLSLGIWAVILDSFGVGKGGLMRTHTEFQPDLESILENILGRSEGGQRLQEWQKANEKTGILAMLRFSGHH